MSRCRHTYCVNLNTIENKLFFWVRGYIFFKKFELLMRITRFPGDSYTCPILVLYLLTYIHIYCIHIVNENSKK